MKLKILILSSLFIAVGCFNSIVIARDNIVLLTVADEVCTRDCALKSVSSISTDNTSLTDNSLVLVASVTCVGQELSLMPRYSWLTKTCEDSFDYCSCIVNVLQQRRDDLQLVPNINVLKKSVLSVNPVLEM